MKTARLATALEKIREATPAGGMTTEEIFSTFAEMYGPKYKRSSLRALLWHQKKLGTIENRNGRYVIASESVPSKEGTGAVGAPVNVNH